MARSAAPHNLDIRVPDGPERTSTRLAGEIIRAVAAGRLRDGDPLPSTRALSATAGVARSIVVAAYDELSAAGYIRSVSGVGTTVESGATAAARSGSFTLPAARSRRPQPDASPSEPGFYLVPAVPNVELLNQQSWGSAWRTALRDPTGPLTDLPAELDLPGADRHGALRLQVTEYLRRNRAVVCDPDDLFFFPTIGWAIRMIVGALGLEGRTVVYEDPGYSRSRSTLVSAGCRVRSVPVDAEGMNTSLLTDADSLVHVTPAHNFPLGMRMSPGRRELLLDWAKRTGGLVLEDDYDGQFRYNVPPVPTLRSLPGGAEHVIYFGTSATVVHPGMGISWTLVPRRIRTRLAEHVQLLGDPTSTIVSNALAEFIRTGALTRHVAYSTRSYAARRRRFVQACAKYLPDVEVLGDSTGLHVTLAFGDRVDDVALAAALADRGLACLPLSPAYARPRSKSARTGLVCGFACLPETRADAAAKLIADALAAVR